MSTFNGVEFTFSLRDLRRRGLVHDTVITVHVGLYLRFLPVIWFSIGAP